MSLHHAMGETQEHQAYTLTFYIPNFGHSSNFCGKTQNCVKFDQTRATMECKEPTCTPPKSVNFDGSQEANFTDRPSYQRLRFLHQRQPRLPKTTTPASQFKRTDIPALKPPKYLPRTHKTWVQAASQTTTTTNPQPLNSVLEPVK